MNAVTAQNLTPDTWLPSGEAPVIERAPAWFNDQQAAALSDYHQLGLPGIRDEQWCHTNLRALKSTSFQFPHTGSANDEVDSRALPDRVYPRMVFVNGVFNPERSMLSELPATIVCTSLATALAEHDDQLKAALGATLPDEKHGFHLLNSAFHSDGYVLLVPQNAVIELPIEMIFYHTDGVVSHTRNVIIAGTNSQCSIIERHVGQPGGTYLNNSITEIIANDGAHVDHSKIQSESDEAFHFGGVFIEQARDTKISTHNFGLRGKLIRNDVTANLVGQGGHIEMNGLVLGHGQQHTDNHTEVIHAVPNCTSDECYKTILDDRSRSVFRGRIVVAQDAQQTNADQQNNNLLLSDSAEADTKPQLEIYADDVKCSHGATVGQLDQKSLFYLQSRGIKLESARALLTFAFANEVLERVTIGSVREELTQLIAGELVGDLEAVL